MRLGATIKTILAALAIAVQHLQKQQLDEFAGEKMEEDKQRTKEQQQAAVQSLQDTFHVCSRLDKITFAILQGGVSFAQETCSVSVGSHVHPMLANPAHSPLEEVALFLGEKGSITRSLKLWRVRTFPPSVQIQNCIRSKRRRSQ
jgi:hypothetical protein